VVLVRHGINPVLRGRHLRLLLLVGALQIAYLVSASISAADTCTQDIIQSGDPLDPRNKFLLAFDGRAWGEVFLAQDTLVEAITVWRWPADTTNVTPLQLYITGAVAVGSDFVPSGRILLSGSTLANPYGDGVHPVEYRYALQPAFALPARGHYYFGVKETTCFSSVPILADTVDSYADGQAWKRGPTFACIGLGSPQPSDPPSTDLVFRIEFCGMATPTNSETWGRLKIRYR